MVKKFFLLIFFINWRITSSPKVIIRSDINCSSIKECENRFMCRFLDENGDRRYTDVLHIGPSFLEISTSESISVHIAFSFITGSFPASLTRSWFVCSGHAQCRVWNKDEYNFNNILNDNEIFSFYYKAILEVLALIPFSFRINEIQVEIIALRGRRKQDNINETNVMYLCIWN